MSSEGDPSATVSFAADPVVVLFVSIGDAPKLVKSKFKIGGDKKFAKVVDFLRKQLQRETLFAYINNAFVPSQDELVADLFLNFGRDGKLIVNYANTLAWG